MGERMVQDDSGQVAGRIHRSFKEHERHLEVFIFKTIVSHGKAYIRQDDMVRFAYLKDPRPHCRGRTGAYEETNQEGAVVVLGKMIIAWMRGDDDGDGEQMILKLFRRQNSSNLKEIPKMILKDQLQVFSVNIQWLVDQNEPTNK